MNVPGFSPPTQKIKTSQSLRLQDEEDGYDDERGDYFQLPTLPRQKSWKDGDNIPSNGNSVATSASWPQETEDVAMRKLEEQWMIVERSLYEEDSELPQGSVLDECVQWRTQIPYLRIIGKNFTYTSDNTHRNLSSSSKRTIKFDKSPNEVFVDCDVLTQEKEDSTQYKLNKAKFEDVLDMLTEHVVSELFPNKENDADSWCESLSDTLKISPARVHGNKGSSKSSKINWAEEAVSPNYIENKCLSIRNRLLDTEGSLQTKNDANYQGIQKRQKNSANKSREFGNMADDDTLKNTERTCTPHVGRNKLGTVFNERIVVSPVPFAVYTRESFSTIKTTPIRFMDEDLEISSFQGFHGSAKKPSSLRNPNIHSAWQAPICPSIWPKNVRLAPIDTSRLPSSRNRSLAPSPAALHCNRKPLSPISRPTIPKSATCDRNDYLEIQGKRIVPAQSSKSSLLSGWDYSPRVAKSKKKKARAKESS